MIPSLDVAIVVSVVATGVSIVALLVSGWVLLDARQKKRFRTRGRINKAVVVKSECNNHFVVVDFYVVNPSTENRTIESIFWKADFPWVVHPNISQEYDPETDLLTFDPEIFPDTKIEMRWDRTINLPLDLLARSSFFRQQPMLVTLKEGSPPTDAVKLTITFEEADGRVFTTNEEFSVSESKTQVTS